MPEYNKKTETIEAIQFTGTNVDDVTEFVGSRTLDLRGEYTVPNFVQAATDGQYAVWVGTSWQIISETSWIIKEGTSLRVVDNDTFTSMFEVPSES